jgi:NADH:ubiquinone oxidoreductase subunit
MPQLLVRGLWRTRGSLRGDGAAWKTAAPLYIRGRFQAAAMKRWFLMLFVWWRGATWGTLLATLLYGRFVGTDPFGNRYYQNRAGTRRWVVYNGTVEASRVPPEWHGWLHHTFREPPTIAPLPTKSWEKEHLPNLSGTPLAYRPEGSLAARGERAPATADYEAWSPE